MKKEILYYTILLVVIVSLIAFETSNISKSDSDVHISKVIDVEAFDKLDIDLQCNIYVSIGDEQRVVLEGPEIHLNRIESRLENGVLKLTEQAPGFLRDLLSNKNTGEFQVNLYLKLTSADQLMMPKNGKLITNESSLNFLLQREQLSVNQHLLGLLKIFGSQLSYIMLPQL